MGKGRVYKRNEVSLIGNLGIELCRNEICASIGPGLVPEWTALRLLSVGSGRKQGEEIKIQLCRAAGLGSGW